MCGLEVLLKTNSKQLKKTNIYSPEITKAGQEAKIHDSCLELRS